MKMSTHLYSTVSYSAIVHYWRMIQLEKDMQDLLHTHIQSAADAFESLLPVACSGYIRPLRRSDIVRGSHARLGWYGYFDSDGDLVLWDETVQELQVGVQKGGFNTYALH